MSNSITHTELSYENKWIKIYEQNFNDPDSRILVKEIKNDLLNISRAWELETERISEFDQLNFIQYRHPQTIESPNTREYILPPGVPLVDILLDEQLSLSEKFSIAKDLIDIVIGVNKKNIIFYDLTWHLFWYDAIDEKLYLLDMTMTVNTDTIEDRYSVFLSIEPDMFTLSPEQSFQTNSIPDIRSNYYSLGIFLYTLFASKLPFQSYDRVSMIHKHLSQLPISPDILHNSPGTDISRFIMKLLAKNPSDRYQSPEGLLHDFNKIKTAYESGIPLENFELGSADFPLSFTIPFNIFTRTEITDRLLRQSKIILKGEKALCLIEGPEGAGISNILESFKSFLSYDDFYVGTGNFEDSNNHPFKGLHEITTDLIYQLLMERGSDAEKIKTGLQSSISELSGVLISFHKEFENLFENAAAFQELSGHESINRFIYAYSEFLRILQLNGKSIILCIRNFDLADIGSFRLVEQILNSSFMQQVMVIITVENDKEEKPGFHDFIDKVSKVNEVNAPFIFSKERVENFNKEELFDLLGKLQIEPIEEFAEILYTKTKGNHSFIRQLFDELISHDYIQPNRQKQQWVVNLRGVNNIDLSDNLHDFLVDRIEQLDEDELLILKNASVIGHNFKLSQLYKITDFDHQHATNLINQLREKGFLLPVAYELARLSELQFSHPGFISVFNTLVEKEDFEDVKIKLVSLAIEDLSENEIDAKLYEVVSHLLPLDAKKCQSYKHLLLKAAVKAKNGAAFEIAGNYYSKLVKIQLGIDDKSDELYDFAYESALSALFALNYELYKSRLSQLKEITKSNKNKYRLYLLEATESIQTGQFEKTIEMLEKGLNFLGIKFSKEISKLEILWIFFNTIRKARKLTIENVESLPLANDTRLFIAHQLMSICAPAVYFLKPQLSTRITWQCIKDTVDKGLLTETPANLIAHAFALNNYTNLIEKSIYTSKVGLKLLENRIKNKSIEVACHFLHGAFVQHLHEPLSHSIKTLEENYKRGREAGNVHMAFYCLGMNRWYYLFNGTKLKKVAELIDASHLLAKDTNQIMIEFYHKIIKSLILELSRGHFDEESMTDKDLPITFSSLKAGPLAQDRIINNNMIMSKLILDHNRDVPVDTASIGKMLLDIKNVGIAPFNSIIQILYACLHIYKRNLKIKGIGESALNKFIKSLKVRQISCPENYAVKYYLIIAAKYIRNGDVKNAEMSYSKAYQYALEYDNLWDKALSSEEYGIHLVQNGFKRSGILILEESIRHYNEWGAMSIVNRLIMQYPELSATQLDEGELLNPEQGGFTHSIEQQDWEQILSISEKILNTKHLKEQVGSLLDATIDFTPSTRSLFVIINEDQFKLYAEKNFEDEVKVIDRPVNDDNDLPESLFRLISRRKEPLIIGNASENPQFRNDNYIKNNSIKSVFIIPFVRNKIVKNILYLENALITDVFEGNRPQLVKVLCSQVSMAIDNAVLTEMLEEKLAMRAKQIQAERDKSDALLRNILPEKIAKELKENGRIRAKKHDSVSVLFTDFKDFSKFSESLSADQIIYEIDQCYRAFDDIVEKYGLEKIKTIGDSYMCAAGIPEAREGHEIDTVNAALEMIDYITTSNKNRRERGVPLMDIRTGIHTGPVIAGIVGHKKYVYDIWGTTVNIASRMESSGEAGRLNISGATYLKVKDDFECEFRGQIEAKSVGSVDMYFVKGKNP